jgi:hypothetical protein
MTCELIAVIAVLTTSIFYPRRAWRSRPLAREAISRSGPHGCGFAEHENADGVLRLSCGQIQRSRRAGDGRREKPPAEPGIVREHGGALVVRREEKSCGMAAAGEAERQFHHPGRAPAGAGEHGNTTRAELSGFFGAV